MKWKLNSVSSVSFFLNRGYTNESYTGDHDHQGVFERPLEGLKRFTLRLKVTPASTQNSINQSELVA